MGLFFRNYNKPGPGVSADAPQKRSFFRFFDIFFRKFGHFSKAGLLYSLALIPTYFISFILISLVVTGTADMLLTEGENMGLSVIILSVIATNFYIAIMGGGPVTAGITYVMRNFANEEHSWIGSDFKENFKSNFKQSAVVFVIDIVVMLLAFYAVFIYNQMSGWMAALKYVIYVALFIYALMHMYIYPIMVTFKLSVKDIYRNSLIFAIGKLPSNFFTAIVILFIHIVMPIAIIFFGGSYFLLLLMIYQICEIVFLQIFTLFAVNFNVYPKIKTYMLDVVNDNKDAQSDEQSCDE